MNRSKGILKLIPLKTICMFFMIWNNTSFAIHASQKNTVGFYCDDESIKHAFHGDTINIYMLFSVLLGVFGFIVKQCSCALQTEKEDKQRKNVHLTDYYTGFLFVITFTEFLKCLFTELRPHFFYTCMPDMSQIDCSKGLVTSFNCTGTGPRWLVERDIYKSFPSGHSSTSVFAFTFISLLIRNKRSSSEKGQQRRWWLNLVPVLFFLWAVMCCLSRILDNRHFWWDVLSGAVIGIAGGYTMAKISLGRANSQLKSS